jgi:hypothetical protein
VNDAYAEDSAPATATGAPHDTQPLTSSPGRLRHVHVTVASTTDSVGHLSPPPAREHLPRRHPSGSSTPASRPASYASSGSSTSAHEPDHELDEEATSTSSRLQSQPQSAAPTIPLANQQDNLPDTSLPSPGRGGSSSPPTQSRSLGSRILGIFKSSSPTSLRKHAAANASAVHHSSSATVVSHQLPQLSPVEPGFAAPSLACNSSPGFLEAGRFSDLADNALQSGSSCSLLSDSSPSISTVGASSSACSTTSLTDPLESRGRHFTASDADVAADSEDTTLPDDIRAAFNRWNDIGSVPNIHTVSQDSAFVSSRSAGLLLSPPLQPRRTGSLLGSVDPSSGARQIRARPVSFIAPSSNRMSTAEAAGSTSASAAHSGVHSKAPSGQVSGSASPVARASSPVRAASPASEQQPAEEASGSGSTSPSQLSPNSLRRRIRSSSFKLPSRPSSGIFAALMRPATGHTDEPKDQSSPAASDQSVGRGAIAPGAGSPALTDDQPTSHPVQKALPHAAKSPQLGTAAGFLSSSAANLLAPPTPAESSSTLSAGSSPMSGAYSSASLAPPAGTRNSTSSSSIRRRRGLSFRGADSFRQSFTNILSRSEVDVSRIRARDSNDHPLLQCNASSVAEMLYRMHVLLFARLELGELSIYSPSRRDQAPTVARCIDSFNALGAWVKWEMRELARQPEVQARVLRQLIRVLIASRQRGDLHATAAIVMALDSVEVMNHKDAWTKVPGKYTAAIQEMRPHISFERNFMELRRIIRESTEPIVPFLGPYQRDAVSIFEGRASATAEEKERMFKVVMEPLEQTIARLQSWRIECLAVSASATGVLEQSADSVGVFPVPNVPVLQVTVPSSDQNLSALSAGTDGPSPPSTPSSRAPAEIYATSTDAVEVQRLFSPFVGAQSEVTPSSANQLFQLITARLEGAQRAAAALAAAEAETMSSRSPTVTSAPVIVESTGGGLPSPVCAAALSASDDTSPSPIPLQPTGVTLTEANCKRSPEVMQEQCSHSPNSQVDSAAAAYSPQRATADVTKQSPDARGSPVAPESSTPPPLPPKVRRGSRWAAQILAEARQTNGATGVVTVVISTETKMIEEQRSVVVDESGAAMKVASGPVWRRRTSMVLAMSATPHASTDTQDETSV